MKNVKWALGAVLCIGFFAFSFTMMEGNDDANENHAVEELIDFETEGMFNRDDCLCYDFDRPGMLPIEGYENNWMFSKKTGKYILGQGCNPCFVADPTPGEVYLGPNDDCNCQEEGSFGNTSGVVHGAENIYNIDGTPVTQNGKNVCAMCEQGPL